MDGMDNQAPGLNFAVGNFIGLTDLDIESIEILPGASSALYGPGGVNGTIILNGKNPFKYPGLSIQVKNGITDIGKDQREKSGGLFDYSLRWAKSFNDKFAFKIGVQYLHANDWLANDTTNYLRIGSVGNVKPGSRYTDPNYDGINVYGDETSVDVRQFVGALAGFYPPGSPQQNAILGLYGSMANPTLVSRTGYKEIDVFDPKTKNLKLSGALHYKFNDKIEGILAGHWGTGNTIYSGNTRYGLKDIQVGQYKAELRHKNWFLRGYTTQEDAGEAYGATVTTQLVNEGWKPSYNPANPLGSWYIQYAQAYIQTRLAGGNDLMAHSNARGFADIGRPAEGSARYTQLFDSVRSIPIPKGGRFVEKSQLWMGEGQYNFSDKIKFAEVIAGGNAKKYVLNSNGTLFIDTAGPIKINEWGVYTQITKKLLNDKLVLSAAGRYDKNENFSGKFTPRFTALINIANSHNIRLSYQTAYKFPTTQQQWIKLDIGSVVLLGGLPWIQNVVQADKFTTYIFNNNQLSPYTYKRLKPESMRSFEVGYKGLVDKKLLIDVYAYFGRYTDITGRILLVQPTRNIKPWSVVANSDTKVNAWGAGAGFDYKMAKNYFSFLNAYTDNLTNVPTGFQAGFNTPKYRINTGFGNSGLGKKERTGFNVVLRWQDEFFWEGAGFVDGTVKAYTTLDTQVNYKLPKIKSMIKIGGTNITNSFYQTGFGNPYIGGMYYVSFTYNIL
jgi:outer membrane receptor protein involved in Fe transport